MPIPFFSPLLPPLLGPGLLNVALLPVEAVAFLQIGQLPPVSVRRDIDFRVFLHCPLLSAHTQSSF